MNERRSVTKSWALRESDDDDSAPEHRVLWEEGPHTARRATFTPPPQTTRMPRLQQVATPPAPSPSPAPLATLARWTPPARTASMVVASPRPMVASGDGPVDPRLVMLMEPDSARAASFRHLCDNLVAKGLPRVLAISSAAAHEGKTTCAVNIALALAELPGATVLLIDGNFFEPALGEIFGIKEDTPTSPSLTFPGLYPFKLAELAPCLHVAAIVPSCGEPAPRFEKHRFDAVLDRLSRGYDRVIIDAPALAGEDAAGHQIIGVADAVLLAVRAGRTTGRALRRAVDQIPRGRAIGVALMDAASVS